MPQQQSKTSPHGYHGRYLLVDVTRGTSEFVSLTPDVLQRFLGGSGLGVYLLLKHGAANLDPWSPAAPIAFVFSPLVGSPLNTSAKFAVVGKSPLTDRINDSLASSTFALAGKKSGCDAVVIVGRANSPSLLVIDDGQVRIESAGPLWGSSCSRAEESLRARFGPGFRFAVIGPGGEHRVRFATVSHDGRHAGRGGSGAVLGAKNLKAVAIRGTQPSRWAHPRQLADFAKELSRRSFGPATAKYRELGTAANLLVFNRLNALPTRNFQQGLFAGATDLSPEALESTRRKTRVSCAACNIGCEHIYALSNGPQTSTSGVRLEYENLFALGSLCGVSDADVVLAASKRCDEWGLDTISTGGTIAFAMECVERGLLDAPWLRFGDGEALLRAIDQIGRRDGLGDRLAEGSRRLADEIGCDTLHFAPQVKGLEIPGYEPRALQAMGLGFAVGTRGADHNRSSAYEVDFSGHSNRHGVSRESAIGAIETEDRAAVMDSLILCKFLRGVLDEFYEEAAEMLHLVTGWSITGEELRRTGQRIVTAKKLFNVRAGWTPQEDTLPTRFFEEALPGDPDARLSQRRLLEAVEAYNRARGWTPEGWLGEELLAELGLNEFRSGPDSTNPVDSPPGQN